MNRSSQNRLPIAVFLAPLLMLAAAPVFANGMTPLMATTLGWLFFGNGIIAIVESAIVWQLYRPSFGKTLGLFLLANYLSCFLGAIILSLLAPLLWITGLPAQIDIYSLDAIWWTFPAETFLATIIAEAPFHWLLLRRMERPWRKIGTSLLLTHLVTYGALVFWFYGAGEESFSTHVVADRSLLAGQEADVAVLFADATDDTLHVVALNGAGDTRVVKADGTAYSGWHIAMTSSRDNRTFSIELDRQTTVESISLPAGAEWEGIVWDYRPSKERVAIASAREYLRGVRIEYPPRGEDFSLIMDKIYASWRPNNVTMLKGDRMVFGWDNQVLLYDIPSRRMALIARGRFPVVILEPPERVLELVEETQLTRQLAKNAASSQTTKE